MKLFKGLALLFACFAITSCGGGKSTSDTTTTPSTTASKVEVLASATSVGSGGDTVTVSAFVKDANNNALADTVVSFATDTGTLTSVSAKTDSSGMASASFATGADKSNRTAVISVTSGSVSGQISLPIEGTKLSISGATTLALNATTTITVTATDSKGNLVSGAPISVASTLNNGLSASSGTTDANGQFSVVYTASTAGSDTVTFSGLGTSTSIGLIVSGEDFTFSSPAASTQVIVGQSQTLSVRYRQNGVAQAGRTVNFAATIGTLSASSAVTDASGVATVNVSSTFAGSSTVSATLVGGTAQATLPLVFVATVPSNIVVQITPTAIAPNSGTSTNNQALVTAKVTDANGNPVANQTVNFSQVQDLSGGQLQQASATTDSNGNASVKYISGAASTSSGGVILKGTVAANTAVNSTASLTVNQSALYIAMGTGNEIGSIGTPATSYQKDWVLYVTDANGVAVPNVALTIKVLPLAYRKGSLAWGGKVWTYDLDINGGSTTADESAGLYVECPNEDTDYSGQYTTAKDSNMNGKLDPGNVISVSPGTINTDAAGRATVSVIYAESYAPWVKVKLVVTAVVSGTESSNSSTFVVQGSSEDFTDQTTPPAGVISPFGERACASNL